MKRNKVFLAVFSVALALAAFPPKSQAMYNGFHCVGCEIHPEPNVAPYSVTAILGIIISSIWL